MALQKLLMLFMSVMVEEKMGEKSRGVWEERSRALVLGGQHQQAAA